MNNQYLIVYKFNVLFQILEELDLDLNFKIIQESNEISLKQKIKNLNNYLIFLNNEDLNVQNKIVFDNFPINIFKLIEKINIEFLKLQFNHQSQVHLSDYTLNLNSREIIKKNNKLKLTEKEINTIIYLSKSDKPVSIHELQENVWKYQSDIETHTVETHIYRLRKKILDIFDDKDFIKSKKNGYQIN